MLPQACSFIARFIEVASTRHLSSCDRSTLDPRARCQVGAVVVSPTRELAKQIHVVAQPFLDTLPGIAGLLLVGGTCVERLQWPLPHLLHLLVVPCVVKQRTGVCVCPSAG